MADASADVMGTIRKRPKYDFMRQKIFSPNFSQATGKDSFALQPSSRFLDG
jgi:hypothetical protein